MRQIMRVLPFIFFIVIFLLSIVPLIDFDIWFHLKSGEMIAQKGIIHYDVFSYNTVGREWYPYEWLFQIAMYWIKQMTGFESIKYATAVTITVWFTFLYLILRRVLSLSFWSSAALVFFNFVSIYEFFSARPHVYAYTFLVINFYFILLYVYKKKNVLWITLPITYIWGNLHGSIFLDVYLFGAYAAVSFIHAIKTKDKHWFKSAAVLGLYTLITAAVSILPPLGFTQYRLLWMFFRERNFISTFIDEWTPLSVNQYGFIFFSVTVVLSLLVMLARVWKERQFEKLLMILPLTPFLLMAYMASRNIVLGYMAVTMGLAWSASYFMKQLSKKTRVVLMGIVLCILGYHVWILTIKRAPFPLYYPEHATQFIKAAHIKGHMFNEYGVGGYLLYHLYPDQQVFYDGRTDLYLCCEMRDTMVLSKQKQDSDDVYKKTLDWLWDKYDISFVLVKTQKHSVLRKITRVLSNDPDWSLVYWDDVSQIFVRHDGKNDTLLEKYATSASTPYDRNPYKQGKEVLALREYQDMLSLVDSAHSRNAIGYILLKQGNIDEAKSEFEKALALDPTFESPYMNIAEIAVSVGDINTAIYLYLRAMELAPDRGLIYIRLGQLYKEIGDMSSALRAWKTGNEKTVDTDAKIQLKQLIGQQ